MYLYPIKGNQMVNQDPFFYVQGAEFEIFPSLEEANQYAQSLDHDIEAEFENGLGEIKPGSKILGRSL